MDLEDFEMATASFFDVAGAVALMMPLLLLSLLLLLLLLLGCAEVDTRPLSPSDASFACLFFFLVMLRRAQRKEAINLLVARCGLGIYLLANGQMGK